MSSLNHSSSGCSESFTDEKKDQESLQFIDFFRPTETNPKATFKIGESILLIVPDSRVEDIVSNICTDLQDQIKTLYVVADKETSKNFNQNQSDKQTIHSMYQKITDHIFSIDLFDDIFEKIHTDRLSKPYLVIIDCKMYDKKLLQSHKFREIIYNGRHYNITFVMITRSPLKFPPEIRANFSHVIIDNSYSNSSMKMIYDHYLGMFSNYSIINKIKQVMTHDEVIHSTQCISSFMNHKVKIYPMTLVKDNLLLIPAINTDLEPKKIQNINQDYDDVLVRVNKTIDELIEIRNLIKSKRSLRTPGGKRLYNVAKYMKENGETEKCEINKRNAIEIDKLDEGDEKLNLSYVRVSSRGQSDDLARQKKLVQDEYPNHIMIEDIGSGVNFNRRGLNKIIDLAVGGRVNQLVIAYKDRLARVGYELIERLIREYSGGEIIIIEAKDDMEPEEELMNDVMDMMNVFVAKRNGLRKYKRNENKNNKI